MYTGEVWCKSYATYSEDDGISIYVELYVPFYYFANPEFTSMSGGASIFITSENVIYQFNEIACCEPTISTTIDTGLNNYESGTVGNITVSGVATGLNVLDGKGAFSTAYPIKIP